MKFEMQGLTLVSLCSPLYRHTLRPRFLVKSVKILSKLSQHVSFICQNLIVVTQSDYKQMLIVMKYDSCFIPDVFSEIRNKYVSSDACMDEAPGVLYPSKVPCMEGHLRYFIHQRLHVWKGTWGTLSIKGSMYGRAPGYFIHQRLHVWKGTWGTLSIKGSMYGRAPGVLYP